VRRLTGSVVLSVALTPAVLVVPAFAPAAPAPRPVSGSTTTIALGGFDRPAAGARLVAGRPSGVPLSPEAVPSLAARAAAARGAVPAGTGPRSLAVRQDDVRGFSAVGVTWQEDLALGPVSVAVRTRTGQGPTAGWSPWTTNAPEEGRDAAQPGDATRPVAPTAPGAPALPSAPRIRGGSELVWTGPSTGVEVVVTSLSGRAPADVRVELVDPGTSAADANPGGTRAGQADAALAKPTIYSRATWGADPSLMTWSPNYANRMKAVVIHHTASANGYSSSEVPAILRSIYRFHAVSRGWGDIGYNVLVDRFGRAWEGRVGGLSRLPIGAHAGGFNTGTVGISVIGDHSSLSVPYAAKETVARVVAWKMSQYGMHPAATTQITGGPSTKYPANSTITVPTVYPHRMSSSTSCPGEGGMAALGWIRYRASQLVSSWATPTRQRNAFAAFDTTSGWWRSTTGAAVHYGNPGDVPVPADWNGDTVTNLAVFRPSTGEWWVSGRSTPTRWGQVGDVPVAAFWGEDDILDHAVWRPSNGTWYVRGWSPVQLGRSGDTPVPADWTGDGHPDMAVFRDGLWTIRGVGTRTYGGPGDIPVPADYDGDGRTDLAVFRPSTGLWYVNGVNAYQYGMRGDVPMVANHLGSSAAELALHRPSRGEFHVRSGPVLRVSRTGGVGVVLP